MDIKIHIALFLAFTTLCFGLVDGCSWEWKGEALSEKKYTCYFMGEPDVAPLSTIFRVPAKRRVKEFFYNNGTCTNMPGETFICSGKEKDDQMTLNEQNTFMDLNVIDSWHLYDLGKHGDEQTVFYCQLDSRGKRKRAVHCVSKPNQGKNDHVGEICKKNHYIMYNDNGQRTCGQCCKSFYWETKKKVLHLRHPTCLPCAPKSTTPGPGVWPSCTKDPADTTTTTTSSTTTTTEAPTSEPVSTTETIQGPETAPRDIKVVVLAYTANVTWTMDEPVDSFLVEMWNEDTIVLFKTGVVNRNYIAENLEPNSHYSIRISGLLSGVPGPSLEQQFLTLKKRPMQRLKLVDNKVMGTTGTISWEKLQSQGEDEEPIQGVKISCRTTNGSKIIEFTTTSIEETSIEFDLPKDSQFKIYAMAYSALGNGPISDPIYMATNAASDRKATKSSLPTWAIIVLIVIACIIALLGVRFVVRCLSNRRRHPML